MIRFCSEFDSCMKRTAQGTGLLCSFMVEREKLRDHPVKEAVLVMPLFLFLGFIPC